MTQTLFVARAVAKTIVVMTAPKRGPRASIIVGATFEVFVT
jgi:hypothetical protein